MNAILDKYDGRRIKSNRQAKREQYFVFQGRLHYLSEEAARACDELDCDLEPLQPEEERILRPTKLRGTEFPDKRIMERFLIEARTKYQTLAARNPKGFVDWVMAHDRRDLVKPQFVDVLAGSPANRSDGSPEDVARLVDWMEQAHPDLLSIVSESSSRFWLGLARAPDKALRVLEALHRNGIDVHEVGNTRFNQDTWSALRASPIHHDAIVQLLRVGTTRPTAVHHHAAAKEEIPVDVLLVTVTEVEANAVLALAKQVLGHEPSASFIGPKTYYRLGLIGQANTFMVRTEMGSGGPSGSALTVSDAIEVLQPSAIVSVGIAFGIDRAKQRIGDVLVSERLVNYELQRIGTRSRGTAKILPRGDRASASPRLLDRFRDGAMSWSEATVKFGLILSGHKLIDNLDYRNQIRKLEPESIGGEMEGAGLYDVAVREKVDWILAKAICDWADGKKAYKKKERQELAAANAGRFVFHVLRRGGMASRR